MKFDPISEEELREKMGTLSPGRGTFQIETAEDKVSKAGNAMLALKLKVWDNTGREGFIFEYITNSAQWKLKGLLEAIGHPEIYDRGEVNPDELVGEGGDLIIAIQKDSENRDQAKVKSYVIAKSKPSPAVKPGARITSEPPSFQDEDIPF